MLSNKIEQERIHVEKEIAKRRRQNKNARKVRRINRIKDKGK
jgi:hypothetical protein